MATYKLEISYNGTNFHGFQIQPKNRTIQGEMKQVLDQLLDNYDLSYSGRTDSGVHAKSQIICDLCSQMFALRSLTLAPF